MHRFFHIPKEIKGSKLMILCYHDQTIIQRTNLCDQSNVQISKALQTLPVPTCRFFRLGSNSSNETTKICTGGLPLSQFSLTRIPLLQFWAYVCSSGGFLRWPPIVPLPQILRKMGTLCTCELWFLQIFLNTRIQVFWLNCELELSSI